MSSFLKLIFKGRQYGQRLLLAIAIALAALQIWATPANATAVYEIPSLEADKPTWVIDQGEVLSRINQGSIGSKLSSLAKETGKEVRFVTIRRLDYGETPTTFADKLFEMWFPTPEAQANQAILVLDTITNEAAIHAGAEVKSLLTDEIAQSVTGETLQVPLREGDKYNEALLAASDRLTAVLSGQPDPGPPLVTDNVQVESTFKKAEDTDRGNATTVVIVLLLLATIIPMVTYFWYQGFSNN